MQKKANVKYSWQPKMAVMIGQQQNFNNIYNPGKFGADSQ